MKGYPHLSNDIFEDQSFLFAIMNTSHKYGDILNMHTHEFIEIGYVLNGKGIHVMLNNASFLSKGDIYIIQQEIEHQIVVYENDSIPLCIYNCIFSESIFQKYKDIIQNNNYFKGVFNELILNHNPDLKLSDTLSLNLKTSFDKIYASFNDRNFGYQDYIIHSLFQILLDINTVIKINPNITHYENIIYKSINYITEHLNTSICIHDLAANAFLSLSQFSKIFKLSVGMSVHEYIQETKILLAKKYIKNGYSLREVAQICGYIEYSTFYRAFMKVTGVSPKDYLKNI